MNIFNTSLFASRRQRKIGVGFHNVGSGILRASDKVTIQRIEAHYGERCGHFPLNAERVYVLVDAYKTNIQTQLAYLSQLYGKEITAITAAELYEVQHSSEQQALVVPYINVPEAEQRIQTELGAETWGIAGNMVTILKNKADFNQLLAEFALNDFQMPEYRVVHIAALPEEAFRFLSTVEEMVKEAGVPGYPLGIMMRTAESDGNYGCSLAYEKDGLIEVVQDGDAGYVVRYTNWNDALAAAQKHLAATMNQQKEVRVVISRFLDLLDSPGLSAVVMNGQVESLGWNGQLQMPGSKACVGTSTYKPKSTSLLRLQQKYEEQTAAILETILRKTAQKCGVDFASLRGVANIDIMLPGKLEERLQERRGQKSVPYIAECNPRWTNYTDAIMTIIGVSRREQTISSMRSVIQEGIMTVDRYSIPEQLDPDIVREHVFLRDDVLKREGVRIICRMATHPMGFIFAGDVEKAQQEVAAIIYHLLNKHNMRK